MSTRMTLKQVALAAGVHHTTVSRALRGHRSIPAATRERLRRLAARMGYRPDAMLSSLIAYRQKIHRPKYNATLAWVTNYPTRDGWREQDKIAPPYQGAVSAVYRDAAESRAHELGYGLETFWMRESHPKGRRLSDVLDARNVGGILLAPQPRARSHTRLDWSRFSAVGLGFSLSYPALHTVGNNHFESMVKILRELKARGYRRVGLCLFFDIDERVNNHYRAAHHFLASLSPAPVPYFWSRAIVRGTERLFNAWFDRHRPDAVVSCNWEAMLWLLHRGLDVPGDVGFALTSTAHPAAICSGIYEHPEKIGRMAVDHVVGMIHRGERGIPELPCRIVVDGNWCDGRTLRARIVSGGKAAGQRRRQQAALRRLPVPASAKFELRLPHIGKWLASLPE